MSSIAANLKFKVGQRVQLSAEGKRSRICRCAFGTVLNVNRTYASLVLIQPDTYKNPQEYDADFWEVEKGEAKAREG